MADCEGKPLGTVGQGSWNMQPQFSPQGDRLVFASNTDDWTLAECRADGTEVRTLSRNLGWMPRYTPDGQKVVFTGLKDNDYRTFVLDKASGQEKLLSLNGGFELHKDVAPDGKTLAFESGRGGYKVMLTSLEQPTEVPIDPVDAWYNHQNSPVFAPDGRSLVYERGPDVGDTDLYRANVGPFGPTGTEPFLVGPGNQIEAAFSPDGRFLAYASDENGDYDIFVARLDGRGQLLDKRALTRDVGDEYAPAWSPDGKKLAFRTHSDYDGEGFRVLDFSPNS